MKKPVSISQVAKAKEFLIHAKVGLLEADSDLAKSIGNDTPAVLEILR